MQINSIKLGVSSLKQNKIKKSNSNIISTPIKDSHNLAKLSLEQLQGMNNISFKGNSDELNEIRKIIFGLNLQNGEIHSSQEEINKAIFDIAAIINSLLLKTDKDGRNFFHKASGEDLEARKREITPQLLRIAIPARDNYGNTCLHYKKDPKFVKIVSDILGDEAHEIFAETLAMKNNGGDTFLHNKQYPETLEMYRKILGDKASEIFANACFTRGKWARAIDLLVLYEHAASERSEESNVVFKALGNRTAEIVRNYRDKNNNNILFGELKPQAIQIMIDNMGDESPEILTELLSTPDDYGRICLRDHCYSGNIEIYRKGLKDKASEVFTKVYFTKKYWFGNIKEYELTSLLKALGDQATEKIKNHRNARGSNIFFQGLRPEIAQILLDIFGDEKQQVLYEMLLMQDNNKDMFLHYEQYPETLEIYRKTLGDKAPEVFAKACLAKNNNGEGAIRDLICDCYYSGEPKRLDESKVVFKALGNKTAEVVRNYRDKIGNNIFHYTIYPEIAQIIVDNMGDEKQQVLYEMLPLQNNNKKTFKSYYQHSRTLKIYRKTLGDKAPEVFAENHFMRY